MRRDRGTVRRAPYPHIVRLDGVCGGEAIIEGTRIAVWHVAGYYYKVGMSVEEILAEWDYLTPAQVFSALAYYHDHKEEIDRVREQNSYEHWQERHAHAVAAPA
ncbi:MAG: DUF433 domain-containing protein [Planctomycetes bacterium]|nr:DUF433 domain-containing protein [Planctomycetota bacterium]MBM4084333.1 DUF433 domain-containing protein [Planctomycetota bacterium]